MTISRSNSQTRFDPPAPKYIPPAPDAPDAPGYVPPTPAQAKAQAMAKLRHEEGFVREAVKPRGGLSALKRLNKLQDAREGAELLSRISQPAPIDISAEHPADAFCFLMTSREKSELLVGTGSTTGELQAFQDMVSGKPFCLRDAQAFALNWSNVPKPHAPLLVKMPFYAFLDRQATGLATASSRINFVHSKVDFKTEVLNPEYDLGALVKPEEQGSGPKPEVAGILNPASRSGWGKSGASKAIQDGARGTAFQGKQKALYQRQTNLVGNAPVGQAYVVPVSEDKVVFSVAGPNHKHHTGLRIKLPRLSHLLKPGHVSKSQESKLRAAYRTFFASVDQYNADAGLTGKDAIKKLHMVPISANVFGFPKDKAASIMAEEILRYTAQNPDIGIQVLAVNDDVLAGHVKAAFDLVGADSTIEAGIPKQA